MTIITGYRGLSLGEVETASRYDGRRMWKTARKEILRPRQFDDTHLLNTINMLNRRHEEILEDEDQIFGDGFGGDPITEGPEDRWKIYPMLVREARRRGLMSEAPAEKTKRLRAKLKKGVTAGPPKIDKLLFPTSTIPVRIWAPCAQETTPQKLDCLGMSFRDTKYGKFMQVAWTKNDLEEFNAELTEILRKWF